MKKLKEVFTEYKKSINWTMFFGWSFIFNIGLLFDWSIVSFLTLNALFLFMSILIYIKWKYRLP